LLRCLPVGWRELDPSFVHDLDELELAAADAALLSFHGAATGTNRLISPVLDRFAGWPEYKVTPVRVHPTGAQVLLRP
jgi:hypothetical protein